MFVPLFVFVLSSASLLAAHSQSVSIVSSLIIFSLVFRVHFFALQIRYSFLFFRRLRSDNLSFGQFKSSKGSDCSLTELEMALRSRVVTIFAEMMEHGKGKF